MCIERARLEETTDRLRLILHQREEAPASIDNVIEFAIPAHERVLRTALFSAEIDLAFHRARCLVCRPDADSELLAA